MAKPRVFVSSTYYDLKHLRATLDVFIRSLGFESVLSEKGDIAYAFDRPLDDSCYREAGSADIFVMIIGGRYGSAASDQEHATNEDFIQRYASITEKEYDRASENDVPIYILIDSSVAADFETYKLNRANTEVIYAHVDSVNIFHLIEKIVDKPRNSPVHHFDRFSDIEEWLKEQWAGLFLELLRRTTEEQQLRALSSQIAEMRDLNETLRRYMETVVSSVAPESSSDLISSESKRLDDSRLLRAAADERVVGFLARMTGETEESTIETIVTATTPSELLRMLFPSRGGDSYDEIRGYMETDSGFMDDVNTVRSLFDSPPLARLRHRSRHQPAHPSTSSAGEVDSDDS